MLVDGAPCAGGEDVGCQQQEEDGRLGWARGMRGCDVDVDHVLLCAHNRKKRKHGAATAAQLQRQGRLDVCATWQVVGSVHGGADQHRLLGVVDERFNHLRPEGRMHRTTGEVDW